jgi:predicted nucleic acid-binding protein
MGAVVLDSSVVIALFDPADVHHQASAGAAVDQRVEVVGG